MCWCTYRRDFKMNGKLLVISYRYLLEKIKMLMLMPF